MMISPKRGNRSLPLKPNFGRSPSLPMSLSNETDKRVLTDSRGSKEVQAKDRHHKLCILQNESSKACEPAFVGFGAPHPKLSKTAKHIPQLLIETKKQNSPFAMVPDRATKNEALLKGAERLIQSILQNENVEINQETIQLAMQQNAALQAKKRYTSLLGMPWRVSVNPLSEDNDCSESSTLNERMTQIEEKNPKSFRRSVSSDGPRFMSNQPTLSPTQGRNRALSAQQSDLREIVLSPLRNPGKKIPKFAATNPKNSDFELSKIALNEANKQITSLRRTIEEYQERAKLKSSVTPTINGDSVDIHDESLSSTNIDDDDEIVTCSVATLTTNILDVSANRPLDYIRAISPNHRSNKNTTPGNVVSRLEYRALQIRNEQLLNTIRLYEEQLDQMESISVNGHHEILNRTTNSLGVSGMSNEHEKEIMVDIVSRLNVADNEHIRQLQYMESKIAALVQQLNYSESRYKSATENDAASKSIIDELSKKLVDCELKSKEFNEHLMIQTERRIDDANKAVTRMEQEAKAAKEDSSRAIIARLSAEEKYLQMEQTNETLVESFRNELNRSETKTKNLEDEVNSLMGTSVEIIQLRTEIQSLQTKLQQTESLVSELQTNEPLNIQSAVEVIRRRTDSQIELLENSLSVAKSEHEAATRHLANLESAQSKEQEILRDELRDSETTIAYLMEEIEALKPLMEENVATVQLLKDQQDEFELKEIEITESKVALSRAEEEIEELRNELQMLTSLPDIVRKMQKELKEAQSKLAKQNLNSGGSKRRLDSSLHADKKSNERKELELRLMETKDLLFAKELELSKCVDLQLQLNELQEAYYVAEDERVALKNQIDMLRPLASDLENAERELQVACQKVDITERKMEDLSNELELLKPLTADIHEAERELDVARLQLAERNREIYLCQAKVTELQLVVDSMDATSNNAAKVQTQLECAEKQVSELRNSLESAERKMIIIDSERQNEKIKLSKQLLLTEEQLTDLQMQLQSREESDSTDQLLSQLAERNRDLELRQIELQAIVDSTTAASDNTANLQAKLAVAEKQVSELKNELESTKRQMTAIDIERQNEQAELTEQLRVAENQLTDLQTQFQCRKESDSSDQLRKEIEMKGDEIESLKLVGSEMKTEISECHAARHELQADQSKKEQTETMMELNTLVKELRLEIESISAQSMQVTLEYATLIPERSSLRKQVAETTSKIETLEKEIIEKSRTIYDLTTRNDEILESLQQEHNRTLERCSDLSLQLAESQYTIVELTEHLRGTQSTSIRTSQSNASRTTSAGMESFRTPKAFQSLLHIGIDRISSRLDESLRGASNLPSTSRNMQS